MTQQLKPKNCKLIIRNLPPTLTEDAFLSTLSPDLLTNSIDFYYYTLGKTSEKRPMNSVAYLHFKTEELAKEFTALYQGHVFINSKGKETKALVDIAPFQKIPRANKKRQDYKENTIDQDPSFLEFVASLNVAEISLPSAEEQLDKRLAEQAAAGITPDTPIITPLIAYVRLRKANRGKGMPSKIAILKRNEGKKERRRKEKGPKGEKKKDDKPLDPNKKKNRKRDREDRKKKKREAEKEGGNVEGEGINTTPSDPSLAAAPSTNPPKKERPPRKERGNNEEGEKGGKGRGNWQKKHMEPGAVTIQPRASGAADTSSTAINGVNPSLQQRPKSRGRGAPLNGNAASFVSNSIVNTNPVPIREPLPMNPAAAPVIPAAFVKSTMEATSVPFVPSGIILPPPPVIPLNGSSSRRGGRGGGVSGNKEPKFKPYSPKPQIPAANGTGT